MVGHPSVGADSAGADSVGPVVPQPSIERLPPLLGHPIVVGIRPGQPALVAAAAARWAEALPQTALYFAYVDPTRYVEQELPDGTVRHATTDPDAVDDEWHRRQDDLVAVLTEVMAPFAATWHFRYLAGRPDRALTHLARRVDAAAIMVGAAAYRSRPRWRQVVEGSLAARLAHHQHRPVVVVPLQVIDWKEPLSWQ